MELASFGGGSEIARYRTGEYAPARREDGVRRIGDRLDD